MSLSTQGQVRRGGEVVTLRCLGSNILEWQQTKNSPKREFAPLQTSSILFNLSKVGDVFLVESKRTVSKLENGKRKFLSWFIDSMKRALEIKKFHFAVVQPRQRNEQKAWSTCKFVVLFLPSPMSLVLLWSKNSATTVTWRHTSPLYCAIQKCQ